MKVCGCTRCLLAFANAAQVVGKLGQVLAPSEQVCAVIARQVGKIVAGRQLWNYDNLEPAEKKLIL